MPNDEKIPSEAATAIAGAVLNLDEVLRTYTTMDSSFSIRLKQADFERVAFAMGSTGLSGGKILIRGTISIEAEE